MKAILPILAIFALSAGSLTAAPEKVAEATESKEESESPVVGLLFEWIELDHRQANKLIRKHATQLDSDGLRAVLETMLDEEQAELVETSYLVIDGSKGAKVESVDEHIYPTEYDPPEIPQKIHKDMPLDQIPISPANPTAFDVRNVGTTVEAVATVNRGSQTINLNLQPEIVKHLGNRTIGDPQTLHAALAHVYMPDFYTMKLVTNLVLQNGKHSLISLFTPAGKKDKRVMLLVRGRKS